MQTPFYAYYTAMKLNMLQDEDTYLPVFAEGNISVYPYQVAAALFAMRNPYQKGVILCDEAGMGKSHEAMLILSLIKKVLFYVMKRVWEKAMRQC